MARSSFDFPLQREYAPPFTKSLEICTQCLTCNGFGEVRGDGRPCPGDWLGF